MVKITDKVEHLAAHMAEEQCNKHRIWAIKDSGRIIYGLTIRDKHASKLPYFSIDNARVIYTKKGLNS